MSGRFIRALALAGALGAAVLPPVVEGAAGARLTLKERAGTKGAGEQRVNDCKVPLAQRSDRHGPAACAPKASARQRRLELVPRAGGRRRARVTWRRRC